MIFLKQEKIILNILLMLYQMKLHDESFKRTQSGERVLELRLYDEKRQRLRLNDEIEFAKASNLNETIRTRIIGLLRYNSFADILYDMPAAYLGYDESEKEYLIHSMYEIYAKEEEEKYGVLGIRFVLVK